MLKNFFESISIKSMVNESFAQPKVFVASAKKFIGCDVFFDQDILRWSIREICSPHPKKSVTKWLRMKNIFTDSKQIFTDLTSIKKFFRSVLSFCLFLVPLNTFGQEFVSVCDRSDFVREVLVKHLQDNSDPNGSCETAHSILGSLFEIGFVGEGENIENFKDGDFSGLSELEILRIHNNQVGRLPVSIFQELSRLRGLALSYNKIEEIPEGIFHGLSLLEVLNVSFNNITSLPEESFQGLFNLTILDLSHNKLKELPPMIFQDLPQLQYLDLRGNQFEEIPLEVLRGFSQLKILALDPSVQNIDEIRSIFSLYTYIATDDREYIWRMSF